LSGGIGPDCPQSLRRTAGEVAGRQQEGRIAGAGAELVGVGGGPIVNEDASQGAVCENYVRVSRINDGLFQKRGDRIRCIQLQRVAIQKRHGGQIGKGNWGLVAKV